MKAIVLGTNAYSFAQQGTGEIIEGITVHLIEEPGYTGNTRGAIPMRVTAPLSSKSELEKVPAYYDVEFTIKPGQNGKPTMVYKSAKYIEALPLNFGGK